MMEVEELAIDHNDPMVRTMARAIMASARERGATMDREGLSYVSVEFAEAALAALEEDGWI